MLILNFISLWTLMVWSDVIISRLFYALSDWQKLCLLRWNPLWSVDCHLSNSAPFEWCSIHASFPIQALRIDIDSSRSVNFLLHSTNSVLLLINVLFILLLLYSLRIEMDLGYSTLCGTTAWYSLIPFLVKGLNSFLPLFT